ncbi:uncharacterized mitochondrial protein-like protein [Tanacetum coccineum]
METRKPLLKDEDGEEVDVHLYRSMIGSLMYLTSSRPDIMFAVYSPFDLVAYTDSDYAGASLDRKSTTGGCQFLGCRLISWQCKKQTVVANSTTEAEYVAASSYYGQKGIGVNAGDSKLMMLGINLLLLGKVNAARHNLLLLVIVDFLNASSIKYALTVNPTIYTSCIEQFWSTVKAKTVNGEVQLQALVDGKKIVVTEASVRRDLQLEDANGVDCLPNATIFEQLTLMGGKEKVFLEEMGEGSASPTNPHHAPIITQPSTSQPQKKQKPRKPKRKDTKAPQPSGPTTNVADEAFTEENVTKHSNDPLLSVIDLETTKTTQGSEIASLKIRVKKLEKKNKSRTYKLKRLYKIGRSARVVSSEETSLGDQEDASKRVLNDEEVFTGQDMAKKEVSTADPVTTAGEVVTTANVKVSTASPTTAKITNVELTLAQTLAELKSARPKTKGVVMQEPSESITTTTIPSNDKGKGIMVKEPLKMKKKDHISFDEQEAIRLQAEFDEEMRLAREKDEANIALIEEWNDIQAKIEVDQLLAERLQAREQEELTIEEMAKLFQQLLEKRRKFFTAKRAEEKRNKPPTKAQQRSIMTTYLKNMAGWKPKDLKNKSLPIMMEVIPDEEEVAVDAIPLATKPPSIVDWKIIKEGKIGYYQIIRADGNLKRYSSMIQMLKSFDSEDLETLWKLVKAKNGYTRPEEGYKRVLWGDLKTMFEHNIEDTVWRNLLGNKVLI